MNQRHEIKSKFNVLKNELRELEEVQESRKLALNTDRKKQLIEMEHIGHDLYDEQSKVKKLMIVSPNHEVYYYWCGTIFVLRTSLSVISRWSSDMKIEKNSAKNSNLMLCYVISLESILVLADKQVIWKSKTIIEVLQFLLQQDSLNSISIWFFRYSKYKLNKIVDLFKLFSNIFREILRCIYYVRMMFFFSFFAKVVHKIEHISWHLSHAHPHEITTPIELPTIPSKYCHPSGILSGHGHGHIHGRFHCNSKPSANMVK